jgi:hypothetical protein
MGRLFEAVARFDGASAVTNGGPLRQQDVYDLHQWAVTSHVYDNTHTHSLTHTHTYKERIGKSDTCTTWLSASTGSPATPSARTGV